MSDIIESFERDGDDPHDQCSLCGEIYPILFLDDDGICPSCSDDLAGEP